MNLTMMEGLPLFQHVFFVHYQCEDFNVGNKILSLCIYAKGKAKEFAGADEPGNITLFCQKVKELCAEGLVPVHWNQNRSYYGPDHITERYQLLTGETIELEYPGELNLSDLLVEIYGDEYVAHPRLDSLAVLNQCNGNSKQEFRQRTFAVNRLLLLTKIYHRLLLGKLVTELKPLAVNPGMENPIETPEVQLQQKGFSSYLLCSNQEQLAKALKEEFAIEKGKAMRLLLAAMEQHNPPLMVIGSRQGKEVYESLKKYFDRNIGSYQSIFGYKIDDVDEVDISVMKTRLKHVLFTLGIDKGA